MARSFHANAEISHIKCQKVAIEAANRISLIKRYHELSHRANNIIKTKYSKFTFEEALLGYLKSINDSTGPHNLVPTLLIFGTMTSLDNPSDTSHPYIAKCPAAVVKAAKVRSL